MMPSVWLLQPLPLSFPLLDFAAARSNPKDTANLDQTLDRLLKKNQQLIERSRNLMDEAASLSNNPLHSIPPQRVQTLDHLTNKNRLLQEKNQKLLGEVAAVRERFPA